MAEGRKMMDPVGSLFRGAWKHYAARFGAFMEIILLPILIVALGYVLIFIGSFFAIVGGLLVFAGWIALVLSAIALISAIHEGSGVDDSYRAAIPLFWPFLWLAILSALATIGGFVVFIIPGIWLGVSLWFAAYVFVIERRRGVDALRQSREYVKGYWWACFGRSILLAFIFWVIAVVILAPTALLAGKLVALVLYFILVALFVPFSIIYQYLIYENLRQLKPAAADARTNEGTGLIVAGAIVGLVAFAAAIILIAVFAAFGVFPAMRGGIRAGYPVPQGLYAPMQPYGSPPAPPGT